jgi:hypothetical protein
MRIAAEVMAQWRTDAQGTPLSKNLLPPRDYGGLNEQDSQLRIWLPDQARQALTEICDRVGTNMTVYLTEFFATYLYGIHEVLKMRETRQGLYEPRPVRRACAMRVAGGSEELDVLESALDDPVPEKDCSIVRTRQRCHWAGLREP